MDRRKSWKDLSPAQQRTILLSASVQLTLLVAALADLARRPKDQVRGSKRLWALAAFVNFIGPLAYFLLGRRKPAQPATRVSPL